MCNLSAEWILETRRRSREMQDRAMAAGETAASMLDGGRPASSAAALAADRREGATTVLWFPVDLLAGLILGLLLVLAGGAS